MLCGPAGPSRPAPRCSTRFGRLPQFAYQERHGTADGISRGSVPPSEVHTEYAGSRETRTVETDDPATTGAVRDALASFGHRDSYGTAPVGSCDVRARLTPSQPFKRGAIWRQQEAGIARGFDTEFTWQVTEHSRQCLTVKDAAFNGNLYSSCAVHGADGFAFVVHLDPNGTTALGAGGGGAGYAGLRRALAVEFDTSYNPELGDGAPRDHVQVQARGPDPVTADDVSRLGAAAFVDVADGAIHRARFAYYPYLREDWVAQFTASTALQRFLRDEGEGRRLGTLALWIDAPPIMSTAGNATAEAEYPLPTLAIPFNVNTALQPPAGAATIGFTSATGRSFERHDILSWLFCEDAGCERARAAEAERKRTGQEDGGQGTDEVGGLNATGLDYHRESNV